MLRCLLIVSTLLIGQTASAATFQAQPLNNDNVLITLSGRIDLEDDAKLARLMQPYAKGALFINSNGGNLTAGLAIGRLIKDKGFVTIVEHNCYSACALIWLAGRERYLGTKGIIGFHAVSKLDHGVREVTSSGNALVGAYLAKLGVSDQAVIFMTQANPDDLAILTPARATQLGIVYKAFPPVMPSVAATPSLPPLAIAPIMPTAVGPSYDCTKATTAAAQFICNDADLSRIDLELVQPYYVLRHQFGPTGWKALMTDAINAMDMTLLACGIDPSGNVLPANRARLKTCLISAYGKQRVYWISKLRGAGLQEATRLITQHILLQKRLQNLGFLPTTEKIDGIYGTTTRVAIVNWQTAMKLPPTGVLGEEDTIRLLGTANVSSVR